MFLTDMKNLAYSKATNQSSLLNKYTNAKNAVDSVMTSYSSTDATETDQSWWSVDLDLLSMINEIRLFLHEIADFNQLTILHRTRDVHTWYTCKVLNKPFQTPSSNLLSVTCDSPVDAQFIKLVTSPVNVKLALYEVEVMGFPLENKI